MAPSRWATFALGLLLIAAVLAMRWMPRPVDPFPPPPPPDDEVRAEALMAHEVAQTAAARAQLARVLADVRLPPSHVRALLASEPTAPGPLPPVAYERLRQSYLRALAARYGQPDMRPNPGERLGVEGLRAVYRAAPLRDRPAANERARRLERFERLLDASLSPVLSEEDRDYWRRRGLAAFVASAVADLAALAQGGAAAATPP